MTGTSSLPHNDSYVFTVVFVIHQFCNTAHLFQNTFAQFTYMSIWCLCTIHHIHCIITNCLKIILTTQFERWPVKSGYARTTCPGTVDPLFLTLYRRCCVRALLDCLSAHATPEVCHMQCTEIVTEQSVCGPTSVFVANCWLVRTGRGSANRCLIHRSVLYTKAEASCFIVPC